MGRRLSSKKKEGLVFTGCGTVIRRLCLSIFGSSLLTRNLFGVSGFIQLFIKRRNFWVVRKPTHCSWAWKKILQLNSGESSNFPSFGG